MPCVVWSISCMLPETCLIASDWSRLAREISVSSSATSREPPTMRPNTSSTSPTSLTPVSARAPDSSISDAVSRAASAERMARLRTSCATTAKPRPASPARAASTAAFSARRFVWNAISSITRMMLAILSLEVRMPSIAPTSSFMREAPASASPRARSAMPAALVEFCAVRPTMEESSSMLAVTCSSVAACSLASLAMVRLVSLIFSAPPASSWACVRTLSMLRAILPANALKLRATCPNSSVRDSSSRRVRSPSPEAMSSSAPPTARSGRTIPRTRTNAMPTAASVAIALAPAMVMMFAAARSSAFPLCSVIRADAPAAISIDRSTMRSADFA